MSPPKIVIVGATSAIAKQCTRLWLANDPAHVILLGRSIERLEHLSADLSIRSPDSKIDFQVTDFGDPASIQKTCTALCADGVPDIVLIAHGSLPDQTACQADLIETHQALQINAVSPALFAEGFAGPMETTNSGTIAIIGSVAGDRGRKSNYIYGSAKSLVGRYAQGLQHRLANTNVNVLLIKPGPTETPMTAHLKQQGAKLASAEKVASDIVKGVEKKKNELYTPSKWWLIMMIIRHLPRFIFNKMDI